MITAFVTAFWIIVLKKHPSCCFFSRSGSFQADIRAPRQVHASRYESKAEHHPYSILSDSWAHSPTACPPQREVEPWWSRPPWCSQWTVIVMSLLTPLIFFWDQTDKGSVGLLILRRDGGFLGCLFLPLFWFARRPLHRYTIRWWSWYFTKKRKRRVVIIHFTSRISWEVQEEPEMN